MKLNITTVLIFLGLSVESITFAQSSEVVIKKPLDQKKVESLVDDLEDLADQFHEQVNSEEIESKELRYKYYRSIKDSVRVLEKSAEKIRSDNQSKIYNFSLMLDKPDVVLGKPRDWKYTFVGINYRGAVISDGQTFAEKLGFEIGVTIPVLYGIDLGLGVGSLFSEGKNIQRFYKIRTYLLSRQRFLYLGAEYWKDHHLKRYDQNELLLPARAEDKIVYTVGSLFGIFYIEADVVPDVLRPYRIAPEVGFRIAFN